LLSNDFFVLLREPAGRRAGGWMDRHGKYEILFCINGLRGARTSG
jgi:hypothetical protein